MTRRNAWLGLVAAVALSLSLTACKDTKTLQENEQLKAQVADLQRQNGQMGNDLQTHRGPRRPGKGKSDAEGGAKIKKIKALCKQSCEPQTSPALRILLVIGAAAGNARTGFYF